jgi:hypothetical protein
MRTTVVCELIFRAVITPRRTWKAAKERRDVTWMHRIERTDLLLIEFLWRLY